MQTLALCHTPHTHWPWRLKGKSLSLSAHILMKAKCPRKSMNKQMCIQIVIDTVKEKTRTWWLCSSVTGSRPGFWRKHLSQDGKVVGRSQPCGNRSSILGRDWHEKRSKMGKAWLTRGSESRPVWQKEVEEPPRMRLWAGGCQTLELWQVFGLMRHLWGSTA